MRPERSRSPLHSKPSLSRILGEQIGNRLVCDDITQLCIFPTTPPVEGELFQQQRLAYLGDAAGYIRTYSSLVSPFVASAPANALTKLFAWYTSVNLGTDFTVGLLQAELRDRGRVRVEPRPPSFLGNFVTCQGATPRPNRPGQFPYVYCQAPSTVTSIIFVSLDDDVIRHETPLANRKAPLQNRVATLSGEG